MNNDQTLSLLAQGSILMRRQADGQLSGPDFCLFLKWSVLRRRVKHCLADLEQRP